MMHERVPGTHTHTFCSADHHHSHGNLQMIRPQSALCIYWNNLLNHFSGVISMRAAAFDLMISILPLAGRTMHRRQWALNCACFGDLGIDFRCDTLFIRRNMRVQFFRQMNYSFAESDLLLSSLWVARSRVVVGMRPIGKSKRTDTEFMWWDFFSPDLEFLRVYKMDTCDCVRRGEGERERERAFEWWMTREKILTSVDWMNYDRHSDHKFVAFDVGARDLCN